MTAPITSIQSPQSAAAEKAPTEREVKAAREFEAIFLRTLLHSLEKTTSVSGGGKKSAGQSTYGSMVVGALADKISAGGGIGLAEVVARSLSAHGSAAAKGAK